MSSFQKSTFSNSFLGKFHHDAFLLSLISGVKFREISKGQFPRHEWPTDTMSRSHCHGSSLSGVRYYAFQIRIVNVSRPGILLCFWRDIESIYTGVAAAGRKNMSWGFKMKCWHASTVSNDSGSDARWAFCNGIWWHHKSYMFNGEDGRKAPGLWQADRRNW